MINWALEIDMGNGEEREMFALINTHGGTFQVNGEVACLALGEGRISFPRSRWPSPLGLADLIQHVKRHIALPWIVRLDPDMAREMWASLSIADHATIRSNRPTDVGAGWMFSLCGVDVYEHSGKDRLKATPWRALHGVYERFDANTGKRIAFVNPEPGTPEWCWEVTFGGAVVGGNPEPDTAETARLAADAVLREHGWSLPESEGTR